MRSREKIFRMLILYNYIKSYKIICNYLLYIIIDIFYIQLYKKICSHIYNFFERDFTDPASITVLQISTSVSESKILHILSLAKKNRRIRRDKTVLIERKISRGVIERSSTARWLVTGVSLYRASRARTSPKNGIKNAGASFNWLRTARRVTGYKLIASRLLELPQRQLISKPIKSNGEPVFSWR